MMMMLMMMIVRLALSVRRNSDSAVIQLRFSRDSASAKCQPDKGFSSDSAAIQLALSVGRNVDSAVIQQ